MSTLLLIWVVVSVVAEYALPVPILDIKNAGKKVLYYVILAPALLVNWVKGVAAKRGWFARLNDWLKR